MSENKTSGDLAGLALELSMVLEERFELEELTNFEKTVVINQISDTMMALRLASFMMGETGGSDE